MNQGIQEWTKQNFLKAAFDKFYLFNFWIPWPIFVTETWLREEIHKVEGIISLCNNHHICRADRDTSLAPHQKDREQTKQEGYITINTKTLPAIIIEQKIIEQYFGIYELQILNDNRILCYKS